DAWVLIWRCGFDCILLLVMMLILFFFSSRRRHTRSYGDWSSDVCLPISRSLTLQWRSHDETPYGSGPGQFQVECPSDRAGRRYRSEERRVGKECRSRWGADH